MRRVERSLAGIVLLATTAAAVALPATLERLLPTLPSAQRDALLAREASWDAMTAAQQHALQRRLAAWHALPVAIQGQRREQWQAWQALPQDQQVQVRAAGTAFADLPMAEQQQWHARFDALDRSAQRGWLLGPVLGAAYARLQPLLAQVPAAQRAPLLALLRGMSAAELSDLALLAQRLPPQQRDGLRSELLATPAANRGRWLQQRLER